ncbi:hypothetical protein CEXT_251041 [Caerostris extrusa]|uniref:Uncharacterized protein n=1 Tax=Caerostris extrusa TaxID=172846 RepID=A0AAV4M4V1_CAEEX|nr:hypothetical protein CEXT_251041 [Caerostris extrusa]
MGLLMLRTLLHSISLQQIKNSSGLFMEKLVASKSTCWTVLGILPVKSLTIPRLKSGVAVLLSKLVRKKESMDLKTFVQKSGYNSRVSIYSTVASYFLSRKSSRHPISRSGSRKAIES